MFKKISFLLLLVALFCGAARVSAADTATIYFFWGDGCPHCAKEEVFLKDLKSRYPNVAVRDFEVWKNQENQQLLADLAGKLEMQISGSSFYDGGREIFCRLVRR